MANTFARYERALPVPSQLPLHRFVRRFCFRPADFQFRQILIHRLVDAVHGELAPCSGRLRPLRILEPVGEEDCDVRRDRLYVRLLVERGDLGRGK